MLNINNIKEQTAAAASELLAAARLSRGQILVVGCSTSEIAGQRIGTESNSDVAQAVYSGMAALLKERGIFLPPSAASILIAH